MKTLLFVSTVLFAQADTEAPDLSQLTPKQRQRLDFVLTGFKHEREKLRSGIYRAFGQKHDGIEGDEDFPAYDGQVEVYSAFDYDAGLYRFERTEPNLFQQNDEPVRRVLLRFKYIRTPELSIHGRWGLHPLGDGSILIKGPEARPDPDLLPIDVRNLGAGLWSTMSQGKPLDEAFAELQSRRTTEIVEESNGVFRFTHVYDDKGNLKSIYWFDVNQGFSPIRCEFLLRMDGRWLPPLTLTRLTWTQINDVWVPKTFSVVDREGQPRVHAYDLQFEWESVNRPVPADLFTRESLKLEGRTTVWDRRLTKPILVEKVGKRDDAVVKAADPLAATRGSPGTDPVSETPGRSKSVFRIVIVLANVGLILLTACYFIYRRHARSGSQS